MRIAFFTDSFYPHVDGVTTYVGVIINALIASGHKVMIVAPRWEGSPTSSIQKLVPKAKLVLVPGVRPFFYPDVKFGALTPISMTSVTKFKPDIIHFHTPGFMGFEATALAKLLKIPLVTTFHTYYMEPEGFVAIGLKENSTVSKILQKSLWKISEKVHNPCDVVIAPTHHVGKDLQSRWKNINIQVIPGAVELKYFNQHKYRNILRKKYNLENSLVFLSVGRLAQEKHYEVLITAFSMMLMKYPQAKLVFLGDGPAKDELIYISKVLGIDNSVIFTGVIPYEELREKNYFSIGDVFVTPSTWDTQGLSVVEAMASGLPVVAFNYRAMPEVIGDGGILAKHLDQYDFAKAMGTLAENQKLRESLGKKAVLQSKKYDIQTHLNSLLNLYNNLITEKSGR